MTLLVISDKISHQEKNDNILFVGGVCSDITSQDFIEAHHLDFNTGTAIDCIVNSKVLEDSAGAELIVKAINHLFRELKHNYAHVEEWKTQVMQG